MSSKNEIQDILDTLCKICKDEYPEIPITLVEQIAKIQFENVSDRTQALRKTQKLVNDYITRNIV